MIGVSDKSWLVDLLSTVAPDRPDLVPEIAADSDKHIYSTYFGLGHQLKMHDRPGVFKVSLAGMALGSYLLKGLAQDELTGRLLDLGTGSGILALLLRSLGAHDITASDVSTSAVGLALENESLNFRSSRIRFFSGDLFVGLPEGDRYDTVIFNPPGWRTPSEKLLDRLRGNEDGIGMTPETMFYGDELLLRFLKDLPDRMNRTGRAIVGLNSLVGIRDVLARYKAFYPTGAPLQFQLLERHSLPLLFYSPGWKRAEPFLREEFEAWRDSYGAAYTIDGQGRLYWSYEVVECRRAPTALG
ncbi:methyltransferase [Methylobacterium nodulans]|uniref:Methyltransferase small n=1 Tax=Methylobacterium nodulans (strain LMG 21967 / CNCM I-2342 / ORS 2060) TaxID=460265 RepID=B8IXS6_METNO|nr:methyltransferase [Methylobacterium nodulans]ACL62908.1 methyltransferase small [Methylobacterium nodulans ORS 2060]